MYHRRCVQGKKASSGYNLREFEPAAACSANWPGIRLTTNEWYKAAQLGDSYWLYVVWDPLGEKLELLVIRNPAAILDHAKREIVAARYYDIPADAIKQHGQPVA